MFRSNRNKYVAAGLAALALVVAGDWYLGSGLFPDERTESNMAIGCGYAEKRSSAERAREQYAVAESVGGAGAAVEQYKRASEAATKAESEAKDCEQRARDRSDLAAQWASAHVARDLRTWTLIEILLLAGTIAVGVAAIIQSRNAFKEDFDITKESIEVARQVGENQVRAFVHAERAIIKVKTLGATNEVSAIFMSVQNSGPTPATAVSGEAKIWTGKLGDEEDAVALEFDQTDRVDALVKGDDEILGFKVPAGKFEPSETTVEAGDSVANEYRRQLRKDIGNALRLALKNPDIVIYCRGRIFYRDIFQDRFETEFFFKWYGSPEAGQEIRMWAVADDLRVFHLIEKRPSTKVVQEK